MAAGGSASEQARIKRERAARLEQQASRWEQGAEGERRVARILEQLPEPYVVYHDLRLPAPSKANVDHLVVGPHGIWAIDTKNYTHPVTRGRGRGADTLWNGRYPMRKELAACAWEASATAELIGHPVHPMMTIIAPSIPARAFAFADLRICHPNAIAQELHSQRRDTIDVDRACAAIEHAFDVQPAPRTNTPTVTTPSPTVARAPRFKRRRERPASVRLRTPRQLPPILRPVIALAGFALLIMLLPALIGPATEVLQRGTERAFRDLTPSTTTTTETTETTTATATTNDESASVEPGSCEVAGIPFVTTLVSCGDAIAYGRQLAVNYGLATSTEGGAADAVVGFICDTIQGGEPRTTELEATVQLAVSLDSSGVCPGDLSLLVPA